MRILPLYYCKNSTYIKHICKFKCCACQNPFLKIYYCFVLLDPTGDDYETYWYGSYSPGHEIYSPGNAMSLRYEGTYNYDGFQLVYFQADPGKPVVPIYTLSQEISRKCAICCISWKPKTFFSIQACTSGSASVIAVNEKAELKSPGYPYVLSEHLSCRWLLEASEGQV